jgi:hypothetical protein
LRVNFNWVSRNLVETLQFSLNYHTGTSPYKYAIIIKQKFIGRFITPEEAWAAIEEYKAEHVSS